MKSDEWRSSDTIRSYHDGLEVLLYSCVKATKQQMKKEDWSERRLLIANTAV